MKKIHAPKIFMLSALLLLMLFASCAGSGAGVSDGGAGDTAADDGFELMVLPTAAVYGVLYSPDPEQTAASEAASLMASQASVGVTLAQLYILSAYTGWDETFPSTYESGGVTYTWSRTGDTTTWTYTYDTGSNLLVIMIEVIETGSLRDVEVTIDGEVYIAGTLSADGLTGSVDLYPGDDPTVSYLIEWEPAAAPYQLSYTVYEYTSAIVTAKLNIRVTLDGERGTWAYLNPSDDSVIADGVWSN